MSSSVGAGGLQAECRHGQLQQCQELLLGGITLQPDSGDYAPGLPVSFVAFCCLSLSVLACCQLPRVTDHESRTRGVHILCYEWIY